MNDVQVTGEAVSRSLMIAGGFSYSLNVLHPEHSFILLVD
jgi:hypothetical protein